MGHQGRIRWHGASSKDKEAGTAFMIHLIANGIPEFRCQLPFVYQARPLAGKQLLDVYVRQPDVCLSCFQLYPISHYCATHFRQFACFGVWAISVRKADAIQMKIFVATLSAT